jgi:hypothetical protein
MFGRAARGSCRIRPEVARLFIDAYARGRTLSREEWAALSVMVAMHFPPNARYHRYCQQWRREVGTMRALRAEMVHIGPCSTRLSGAQRMGRVEGYPPRGVSRERPDGAICTLANVGISTYRQRHEE